MKRARYYSTKVALVMVKRALSASILGLCVGSAHATVSGPQDLNWLTHMSQAIVVGKVISASHGKGDLNMSVSVERSLTGPFAQGSVVTVVFPDTQDPAAEVATPDGFGLWFLQGGGQASGGWTLLGAAGGTTSLSDAVLRLWEDGRPSYTDEDATIDKVISELRTASEGPAEIAGPAYEALLTLTPSSMRIAARHTSEFGEPHFETSCEMGRFLSTWQRSLTQRVATYAVQNQSVPASLASTLCEVADVDVVPDLVRIRRSPAVGEVARRCAARALQNVHTVEALPYLRELLDSTDPNEQYMGLAGLAMNANNVLPDASPGSTPTHRGGASTGATMSHFPSLPTFRASPSTYLDFWRNWYPNVAPNVSISGGGASCHPLAPWSPCQLPVTAAATDANGDPLSFKWSSCAPALAGATTCPVSRCRMGKRRASGSRSRMTTPRTRPIVGSSVWFAIAN